MAMEVECPSCHTMLRPTEKMLAEGGEKPCPSCGMMLRLNVPMWMPAEPAPPPGRRPRRSQNAPSIPVWVRLAGGGAVLFVLLLVGGLTLVLLLRSGGRTVLGKPSISRAHLEKVQAGMKSAEVRALLGKPTQEMDSGAMTAFFGGFGQQPGGQKMPSMRIMVWTDNSTYTAAVFFQDDQVLTTVWNDGPPNNNGMPNQPFPGLPKRK